MKTKVNVKTSVGDPKLVAERRSQILRAAVKLFSDKGYYRTTILDIAKAAGISSGLIYQYFGEKEDVLCLSLMLVIDTYEQEIPPAIEGITDPITRLCEAIAAYCRIIDRNREATLLAYRSTKSLPAERRAPILEGEQRSNAIIRECLQGCIDAGYTQSMDVDLHVYQIVMFCHTWALKYWSLKQKYDIDRYIAGGIDLLVKPFLTADKGLAAMERYGSR